MRAPRLSRPDMSALPSHPPVSDPAIILRYRDRQYAAELLAAALLHLDLFTWLSKNEPADTEGIHRQFGLAARPADVLLTLLRSQGFLRTRSNGDHELTPLAREHLVQGSPWYLGPYYAPLKDSPVVGCFLEVLRSGRPANWYARQDGTDWHASMRSESFARDFTALMNCRGLALGQALAAALAHHLPSPARVLDVGGGSGIYAATLAQAHPTLTATVVEQTPVDDIARQSIEAWGLPHRIQVVTADMFAEPWPDAHNVHLLSNVLHDWDLPEIRALLRQSANALPPGGLLVIHEAFLNDAKTGPLPVAEYSALLMHGTMGRCYSAAEYRSVLLEVGFVPGPYADTVADRGFITAVKS